MSPFSNYGATTVGLAAPSNDILGAYRRQWYEPGNGADVHFADVESGGADWPIGGPWAIADEASASPSHAWSDSLNGNDADNRSSGLLGPAIDLTGMPAGLDQGDPQTVYRGYALPSGTSMAAPSRGRRGGVPARASTAILNGVDAKGLPVQTGGRLNLANSLTPPQPCEGDFGHDGDVDGTNLKSFRDDCGRSDCPPGP